MTTCHNMLYCRWFLSIKFYKEGSVEADRRKGLTLHIPPLQLSAGLILTLSTAGDLTSLILAGGNLLVTHASGKCTTSARIHRARYHSQQSQQLWALRIGTGNGFGLISSRSQGRRRESPSNRNQGARVSKPTGTPKKEIWIFWQIQISFPQAEAGGE